MKKSIIAVAVLSTLSFSAFADNAGYYVGIDYSMLNLGNLNSVLGSSASQPSGGMRLDGGYNFTKNWGVEIGIFENGNAAGTNYIPNTTYLTGVGTYAINDMFDIFGKLGAASNQLGGCSLNICGSQKALMYGVGADFNVSKNVGYRLQYESLGNLTSTDANGNQLTASDVALGVIFRF